MQRTHERFPSAVLGRDMEFLWFGRQGRPVVLLPTSAGRFNENEDFGLVGALMPRVATGEIQVLSLDSVNRESWADDTLHPDEKLRRHEAYDRFLSQEFFPWLHHQTGSAEPALYGASLGGWQAATFGARHPHLVGQVVALSGFFDIGRLLKDHWSDAAYYFSPTHFVSNMDEEWIRRLRTVRWVIATGEHDSLVDQTRNFAGILRQKGIPVVEEVWPGVFGHDWPFWKQHLPRLL